MNRRRNACVGHHTIDAIAHVEFMFVRLDVNVGRAFANRFEQQIVDQAHHTGFARVIDFGALGARLLRSAVFVGGFECFEHITSNAVARANLRADVVIFGNQQFDGHSRSNTQLVKRIKTQRITGGNQESIVLDAQRKHAEAKHQSRWNQSHRSLIDFSFIESHKGQRQFIGERAQHLFVTRDSQSRERLLEAFTRAQLLDARSFQLRIGEKPLSNEDRAQCHDSLAYRCMLAHPSRSWNMFVRRVSR